jgi:hypothetical protein
LGISSKVRFLQHLFFQTSISFTMASLQSLYMALQAGEGFSVTTDQKTFTGRGFAVGGTEVPSLVVENDSLSFNQFSAAMQNMASKTKSPSTTSTRSPRFGIQSMLVVLPPPRSMSHASKHRKHEHLGTLSIQGHSLRGHESQGQVAHLRVHLLQGPRPRRLERRHHPSTHLGGGQEQGREPTCHGGLQAQDLITPSCKELICKHLNSFR